MDDLLEDLYKSLEEVCKIHNIDMSIKPAIVGKWYKGPNESYMKFSHIENIDNRYDRYWYNELITPNKTYLSGKIDFWSSNHYVNYLLSYGPVSKEELSQFLPKDHPDLQ